MKELPSGNATGTGIGVNGQRQTVQWDIGRMWDAHNKTVGVVGDISTA